MPLILNIETSTPICSVCVSNNGQVIDIREDRQGNSHARVLTVFIEQIMHENKIAFAELDAIAVSAGPGSYTGLRIGVSAAKGLCYALNKPLIAVSTLQALAKGIIEQTNNTLALFMPVIDARRMDIYSALYNTGLQQILPTAIRTVDEQLEKTIVTYGKVFIGGNGMFKCKGVFKSPEIEFIEGVDCSARMVGMIAEEKFKTTQFEDLAYFQPDYLKEFEGKKKA